LPVRPTGGAVCVGESVGSDVLVENGPSLVVHNGDPVSSGATPASAGLKRVTAIWERGSMARPEKDAPVDLSNSSCLRFRLTKAMAPPTSIKAATPPAIPPAIASVCEVAFDDGDSDDDDDVALTVIWTIGAARANGAYIAPCAGLKGNAINLS